MPFKSKAQARMMFARDPKMARRWAHHTKDMKSLPDRVSEGGMDQYAPSMVWQDIEWQRKWAPDEKPLPPLGEMFGLAMDDEGLWDDDVRNESLPEDVPDDISPRMYFGWTSRRAT